MINEIAENNRNYDKRVNEQVEVAQKLYGIYKTIESVTNVNLSLSKHGLDDEILKQVQNDNKDFVRLLIAEFDRVKLNLNPHNWEIITNWEEKVARYKNPIYSYKVRNKEIKIETHTEPGLRGW